MSTMALVIAFCRGLLFEGIVDADTGPDSIGNLICPWPQFEVTIPACRVLFLCYTVHGGLSAEQIRHLLNFKILQSLESQFKN